MSYSFVLHPESHLVSFGEHPCAAWRSVTGDDTVAADHICMSCCGPLESELGSGRQVFLYALQSLADVLVRVGEREPQVPGAKLTKGFAGQACHAGLL